MSLYALNLFDLAPNDDYRAYARRSVETVTRHGGKVAALGQLAGAAEGDTDPRQVMVLVEWPSRAAFDAFTGDPALADLHRLREHGTERYLWWLYDGLDDLRPLFAGRSDGVVRWRAERVFRVEPSAVWDVLAHPERMADWVEGVEEAEAIGRPGTGQRHVVRGPWGERRFEIVRVCEAFEPQGLIRWRDVEETIDGEAPADPWSAGSWTEIRVEPRPDGAHVVVESWQVPTSDAWAERLRDASAGTEENLRMSLDRLAGLVHD